METIMNNVKKREQYEEMLVPVREAKASTIKTLMRIGQEHKFFKWSIFAVTVIFIFSYNLLYHAFLTFKMRDKLARALALTMVGVLTLSNIELGAFALSREDGEEYAEWYEVESFEYEDTLKVAINTPEKKIEFPKSIYADVVLCEKQKEETIEAVELPIMTDVPEVSEEEELNEAEEKAVEEVTTDEESLEITTDNSKLSENSIGGGGESEVGSEPEEGEDATLEESNDAIEENTEEPAGEAVNEASSEPETENDENAETANEENVVSVLWNEFISAFAPLSAHAEELDDESEYYEEEEIVSEDEALPETEEAEEVFENDTEVATDETEENDAEDVPSSEDENDSSLSEAKADAEVREKIEIPVTWECENYDKKKLGDYEFTAVIPDEIDGKGIDCSNVEIPVIVVSVAEFEQIKLETTVDGMTITLKADYGVFPDEKLTLYAEKVVNEFTLNKIDEQVENVRDGANVSLAYTFDIKVLDEEGKELQPDNERGKVSVSFSMSEAMNVNLDTEVFHVSGEDDALSAESLETTVVGENVTVETDGFSYYVVEFTYGDLEYVLEGGRWVVLSDLLSSINIVVNGEIEEVEVSDENLFKSELIDDIWYVRAVRAFQTEEWMKVTIAGVTYEIKVTDEASMPGARSETNEGTGDVFLGGNYIEVGISKHGSFGTQVPPEDTSFHPYPGYGLGLQSDGDGWDVGEEPTSSDYFLPGTPEERWVIAYEVDGEKVQYHAADRMGGIAPNEWETPPAVVDESNVSEGLLQASVEGITVDGLYIKITYSFGVDDKEYSTDVYVENRSSSTISDVRFVRSFDPDQDSFTHFASETYNKVICNPISEKKGGADNYAMVVARGSKSYDGFFFLCVDNRARVSRGACFTLSDAFDRQIWEDAPVTEKTYAEDEDIILESDDINDYVYEDMAITISIRYGDIAAGANDDAVFYSSLDPNVAESLETLKGKLGLTVDFKEEVIGGFDTETEGEKIYKVTNTDGKRWTLWVDADDDFILCEGSEIVETKKLSDGNLEDGLPVLEEWYGDTLTFVQIDNTGEEISDPFDLELPERPEAPADPTVPDKDGNLPTEIISSDVLSSETSLTVRCQPGQEYTIDGGVTWHKPGADGILVFDELERSTDYRIQTRLSATTKAPVSKTSEGIIVNTMAMFDEYITVTNYKGEYDTSEHTGSVVCTVPEAVIKYATELSADAFVLDATPYFSEIGVHKIYFKVTKERYYTYYGEIIVDIQKVGLTVTGIRALDKEYDKTSTAELDLSEVTVSGMWNSEDIHVTATGEFLDYNAGDDKAVKVTIEVEDEYKDFYQASEEYSDILVYANIYPRVAEFDFSDTKLEFNGSWQCPTAKVTNLCEGDKCIAYLDDYERSANDEGEPYYETYVCDLSNSNYTLPEDYWDTCKVSYVINPRPISREGILVVVTTEEIVIYDEVADYNLYQEKDYTLTPDAENNSLIISGIGNYCGKTKINVANGLTADSSVLTLLDIEESAQETFTPVIQPLTEAEGKKLLLENTSIPGPIKELIESDTPGCEYKATVTLKMREVKADGVSKKNQKLLEESGVLEGNTVGSYWDLSLYVFYTITILETGDSYINYEQISESAVKQSVTISIPEELKNYDPDIVRTFMIGRIHDGEVSIIASSTDNEFKFESSKYSLYFLLYKDRSNVPPSPDSDDGDDNGDAIVPTGKMSPKTGDTDNSILFVLMMMGGAAIFGSMFRKKKAVNS